MTRVFWCRVPHLASVGVDGHEVGGGHLLGLAAGQEEDAGHGRGHVAGQGWGHGDQRIDAVC